MADEAIARPGGPFSEVHAYPGISGAAVDASKMRIFAARVANPQLRPPPLGKRWLGAFLERNPEIRSLRSRQMHFSRVNGATMGIIKPWFNLLRLPAVAEILDENRHNMDEGGVAEGEGSNGIVLGPEGRKLISRKSNGSRAWTSFIECISATGKEGSLERNG